MKHRVIALLGSLLLLIYPVAILQAQDGEAVDTNLNHLYLPLISQAGTDQGLQEVVPNLIPNQYIVILKEEVHNEGTHNEETSVQRTRVEQVASEIATAYGGEILESYDTVFSGFAIRFPEVFAANAHTLLSNDERVEWVEPDQIISLEPIAMTTVSASSAPSENNIIEEMDTSQTDPPWGLDRIDQRAAQLNRSYLYSSTGASVVAYIIDTGIRISHQEFQGRARDGYDSIDKTLPADDCHGHGTHVAATIGGKSYGVAKAATLVAVRVVDCEGRGSASTLIAGVNWVTADRQTRPNQPAVVNMSLGLAASTVLDRAINQSIASGITYVVAAGNDLGGDACRLSPARIPAAITVGATMTLFNLLDLRAYFSNIGRCVDLFAPGDAILSAWRTSDTATAILSGTSMASPHVTGAVVRYLQRNPQASPSTVAGALIADSTKNSIRLLDSVSPNRLLYVAGDQ